MNKEKKFYTPIGELMCRKKDEEVPKVFYPCRRAVKFDKLEQALFKHDYPPNMSRR